MCVEILDKNKVSFHGCWLVFTVAFIWSYNSCLSTIQSDPQTRSGFWLGGCFGFAAFLISILAHEAGHRTVSRIFKIPYPQKILFPFGDIIRSQLNPTPPEPILLIAIAGPAANLLLAATINVIRIFLTSRQVDSSTIAILENTVTLNLLTASINLIPCKPFDGGLFSYYASKGDESSSLKKLTILSKFIPIISIITGFTLIYQGELYKGVWCVLCGFIFQEALFSISNSILLSHLQLSPVAHIMRKNPVTVQSNISLKDFVSNYPFRFNAGIFPVITERKLQGCIDFSAVKAVPQNLWGKLRVADLTEKCSEKNTVSPTTEIIEAIKLLMESSSSKLLVLHYGELCGVLSRKDFSVFFHRCIFTESKHKTKNPKSTIVTPPGLTLVRTSPK